MRTSNYFHTAPMYLWAIFLLALLAIIGSYVRQDIPINLLLAIFIVSILDISIKKFFLKKRFAFPFSAIISGLIIGSIAPFDVSPIVIIVASSATMLSKFLIRLKGLHIFNPATFGLLVALSVFSVNDMWWAEGVYNILGYTIIFTPILVIASYKAIKLAVALPFLSTMFILNFLIGTINDLSILLLSLPFYFAFIMLSEPKTSPYKRNEQIVFGVSAAILFFVLTLYNFSYSLLIALLLVNLAYVIHRNSLFSLPRLKGKQLV